MYSFEVKTSDPRKAKWFFTRRTGVPKVVYWIGLSSLLADVSAESVASVLSVFLFSVLQLSPLETGLLDGMYQGGAAIVRVIAGYIADRRQKNRAVAFFGYALSVLSRIGLLLSMKLGLLIALLSLLLDRVGKGIRTAPRDSIIAGHTAPARLGAAFGVHRSMDAVGAFIGPLLGAALLWWLPFRFDVLFELSMCAGAGGLVIFWTKVREPRRGIFHRAAVDSPSSATKLSLLEAFWKLRACSPFIRLSFLAASLSVFTISDGLIYLSLQREMGLDERFVPMMFGLTAFVFLTSAATIGRLADKFGSITTFMCGYGIICFVYLLFAAGIHGRHWLAVLIVCAIGLHYAATDGILAAIAVRSLDDQVRTTGLAVLATVIGLARIASSSMYGWFWQNIGEQFAARVFALGMTCCFVIAFVVIKIAKAHRSPGPESSQN